MNNPLLDKPVVHMPHLGNGEWLNTTAPLNRDELRGQVVLVDFWDFTCVNCLRTLPYLRAWHERYAEKGLTIIGVHTPEFKIGQSGRFVRAAIDQFSLRYPVLLDNQYTTWEQFANRAWPSKYLVDTNGYIRFHRQGEGYYQETEQAIQLLLRQRDSSVTLPDLLPPLRREDAAGAVCYRTTPELHAGYQGGLFGGALGNSEGYITGSPMGYVLPGPFDMQEGRFYLAGFWRSTPDAMVFAGQDGGRVILPYSAAGVNAVLSPSHDPVELMLDIRPGSENPLIELRQDDLPLNSALAGKDVFFENGRALICVDRPRLYELVTLPLFGSHELDLIFHTHGLALYAFTFNSCIAPSGGREAEVFTRH